MKTLTRTQRDISLSHNCGLAGLLAGLLLLGTVGSRADIIYDNSGNDKLVRLDPGSLEVGDEIVLAGTARYLTNFSFEYWGFSATPNAFAGNVHVCVRFYLNNGTTYNGYPTPGTKFYDSGWFAIQPTPRSTLVYTPPNDLPAEGLLIPDSKITWSVQFQGLGEGDSAGVDIYGPALAGLGYPDYWVRTATTGWELRTNSAAAMNFAGKFQASPNPIASIPSLQISRITGKAVVSWPGWAFNFELLRSAEVAGAPWTTVSSGVVLDPVANKYVYTNTVAPGAKSFFRLRQITQ